MRFQSLLFPSSLGKIEQYFMWLSDPVLKAIVSNQRELVSVLLFLCYCQICFDCMLNVIRSISSDQNVYLPHLPFLYMYLWTRLHDKITFVKSLVTEVVSYIMETVQIQLEHV